MPEEPQKDIERSVKDFRAKLRELPEGQALEAEYAKFMAMGKQLMPDLRREFKELEAEVQKAYDLAEAAVRRLAERFQRFYLAEIDNMDLVIATAVIAESRRNRKKDLGDVKVPPTLETMEVAALKLCKKYLRLHDESERTYKEMTELTNNLSPDKATQKRMERSRRRLEKRRGEGA